MAVTTSIETITPAIAAGLLSRNDHNRPVRRNVVAKYARDMATGSFRSLSGQSITIADDGTLVDGQHRLMAIVAAEESFEFVVVRGVDRAAFDVVDQGVSRSAADAIALHGVPMAGSVSAIARIGIRWHRGMLNIGGGAISTMEVLRYADGRIDDLVRGAQISQRFRGNLRGLLPTPVGFLAAMTHGAGADDFWVRIGDGASLPAGDPRLALRNKSIQIMGGATPTSTDQMPHLHMAIKAWNAYMLGREMRVIRIGSNEPIPPILDGDGKPVTVFGDGREVPDASPAPLAVAS